MKNNQELKRPIIIATCIVFLAILIRFGLLTINYSYNFTSSGGNRVYNGTVSYRGGIAVTGYQHFKGGYDVAIEFICTLEDGDWINQDSSDDCSKVIPLTVSELFNALVVGEIVYGVKNCQHGDICIAIK